MSEYEITFSRKSSKHLPGSDKEDTIGTIVKGKLDDIIAVSGDPPQWRPLDSITHVAESLGG